MRLLLSRFLVIGVLSSFCFTAYASESSLDSKESSVSSSKKSIEIVHPCTDYGFKRAFRHKEVAMGFLNNILGFKDQEQIKDLTYLDKELNSSDPLGRHLTVDLLCETKGGKRFLLEMQNDFREDYGNKALVELCRLISTWDAQVIHEEVSEEKRKRTKAGETYKRAKGFWENIRTAIVVVITNKIFPKDQKKESHPDQDVMEPKIVNSYSFKSDDDNKRSLGTIDARVVLVMLANFTKKEEELSTDLERWLYTLKEPELVSGVKRLPTFKSIHDVEKAAGEDEGLKMFYKDLNKTSLSEQDLSGYEKGINDVNTFLEDRKAEAKAEGKIEGKIEGEKSKAFEIARVMLAKKMEVKLISEITSLNEEEIKALQE